MRAWLGRNRTLPETARVKKESTSVAVPAFVTRFTPGELGGFEAKTHPPSCEAHGARRVV